MADCRAHTDAIGQCTPVKGWMEVGTRGLVGIMPFELRRRSRRRSPLGFVARSCVGGGARGCGCDKKGKLGFCLDGRGYTTGCRVRRWVYGGRDGNPTRRRDASGRWRIWESQDEREVGTRRAMAMANARALFLVLALALALALVDLVPSCCRVHGRQLEGKLEIRSSKRSWTI